MNAPQTPMLTVSEVNGIARDLLENTFMPLWMKAEIGTLVSARSGHVYMTLKDAKAQVRAVMFGGGKLVASFGLGVGSAVEVFGQLSLYVPGGEFQFKVQSIRPIGLGDLQKRFEELKQRLNAEGLFDPERKRPLPEFPRRIGVITSPDGAALHDFLNVLTRRFPPAHVMIYPAPVQGKTAHKKLISGIHFMNALSVEQRPNVLVLTRGGGSIEDLWCFNEEELARAIAESEIPVVSAVGHEIDFTIADFAADFRAPTPSAAAEQIIEPFDTFSGAVEQLRSELLSNMELALRRAETQVNQSEMRLERCRPLNMVRQFQQRVDLAEMRIQRAWREIYADANHELALLEQRLDSVNPDTVLNRGYTYLRDPKNKTLLSSIEQLSQGQTAEAVLKDGTATFIVEKTVRKN